MNPQVQKALEVAKANVALIVLSSVAVIVPVVGWYFGSAQRAQIVSDAQKLGQKLDSITRAGKVDVTLDIPGHGQWSTNVVASDGLIQALRDRIDAIVNGSAGVDSRAVAHNRGRHGPLQAVDASRPVDIRNVEASERRVFPANFHEAMSRAYTDLLSEVGAGSPPAPEAVLTMLQAKQARIVQGVFGLAPGAAMDEAQAKKLREELVAARLSQYADAAASIKFYSSAPDVGAPAAQAPGMDLETFYAQLWTLWITEDVLGAVESANQGFASVLTAPVKRVEYIAPLQLYPPAKEGTAAPAPEGSDLELAAPVGPDFTASITGRRSGPLGDVVPVQVIAIVETARIPAFVDALAKQNFIAILDAGITPVDAFAAANQGFLYGSEPCSELNLVLETVWLRAWTCEMMPDAARSRLGASCGGPRGSADGSADGSSDGSSDGTDSIDPSVSG